MGDFVELIIFLAILIIGLLSGSRKKTQSQQKPRARPQRRPEPAAATQTARPVPQPAPARGGKTLEESLLDLLQQRVPEPVQPEPAFEPVVPEPTEARSLEPLEVSTEQRHAEFHERYLPEGPAIVQGPRYTPIRQRLLGSPQSVRDGIILQTILGPPKGLSD